MDKSNRTKVILGLIDKYIENSRRYKQVNDEIKSQLDNKVGMSMSTFRHIVNFRRFKN
ncbi:MAG: hypothetical protein ORN24_00860 [Burkholderiales bacterium]|nr:hypothetical protein [Burkholderiales bacterium]